ncbi:MAG: Kelch repeat-containing protein [Nitrospinales bacterium]
MESKYFFHATFVFLALLVFPAIATGQSLGFWKTLPPAPTVRTEAVAAAVDGTIYVIGGFTPKGIATRVDRLNLATGIWSEAAPLPRPLHHTSASAVNGKIYVIGGFDSGLWTAVATTYEYDPATDRWQKKRPMPTARGAMAAGVIDGKIYLVGGAHRKFLRLVNTDANEVYDPATDQWRTLSPIPTARDHLTVSTFHGILYAIGGRINVDYNKNLSANEAYDPAIDRWTRRKPMPTARSGITSQVLRGKVFVLGGESSAGTFRENEAYDPVADAWTPMAPMKGGHHGLGSTVVMDQIHVLTGGPNPGGGGSAIHEVFSLNPFQK